VIGVVGRMQIVSAQEDTPSNEEKGKQVGHVQSHDDKIDQLESVVLYQYQVCPFCNKVRAYLDYYNIPYTVVEVDPIFKQELQFSEYKKVPVAIINSRKQVNGSSEIIDVIHQIASNNSHSKTNTSLSPEKEEEKHWREWVDSSLVHTLPPNIYRSMEEAVSAFDYITCTGNFSWYQKYFIKYTGATAMYMVSKRLKEKHHITDEREALYQCAREWMKALGNRQFMGGNTPNLADLAVYGVLRSIEGLRAFEDMLAHTTIKDWYLRVQQEVGKPSRLAGSETKTTE